MKELNQQLFFWINQDGGYHYQLLDSLMILLSDPRSAVLPVVMVAAWVLWRGNRHHKNMLLGVVVLVLMTDWTGGIIKNLVAAPRPCEVLEGVRLLIGCGHNSFPSNHAANNAAMAVYVGLFYRRALPWLLLLPIFVGLSRIYLGVHYPFDVLAGWMWGGLLAVIAFQMHKRFLPAANGATDDIVKPRRP